MSNLDKSFAQLVKFNNGMFKSDKQAAFLSSKLVDNEYTSTPSSVYGNSFTQVYTCDDTGVIKVEKITKNNVTVTWTRDTTDNWKRVNEQRNQMKNFADWLCKAQETRERCNAIIMSFVGKSDNTAALQSMANKRKQLDMIIEQTHQTLQDMQHRALK